MLIEYRVREVTRYYITRFEDDGKGSAGVSTLGEYSNPDTAYEVGYALCKAEHERLGFPLGDERIQYPRHPNEPSHEPCEVKGHLTAQEIVAKVPAGGTRAAL